MARDKLTSREQVFREMKYPSHHLQKDGRRLSRGENIRDDITVEMAHARRFERTCAIFRTFTQLTRAPRTDPFNIIKISQVHTGEETIELGTMVTRVFLDNLRNVGGASLGEWLGKKNPKANYTLTLRRTNQANSIAIEVLEDGNNLLRLQVGLQGIELQQDIEQAPMRDLLNERPRRLMMALEEALTATMFFTHRKFPTILAAGQAIRDGSIPFDAVASRIKQDMDTTEEGGINVRIEDEIGNGTLTPVQRQAHYRAWQINSWLIDRVAPYNVLAKAIEHYRHDDPCSLLLLAQPPNLRELKLPRDHEYIKTLQEIERGRKRVRDRLTRRFNRITMDNLQTWQEVMTVLRTELQQVLPVPVSINDMRYVFYHAYRGALEQTIRRGQSLYPLLHIVATTNWDGRRNILPSEYFDSLAGVLQVQTIGNDRVWQATAHDILTHRSKEGLMFLVDIVNGRPDLAERVRAGLRGAHTALASTPGDELTRFFQDCKGTLEVLRVEDLIGQGT